MTFVESIHENIIFLSFTGDPVNTVKLLYYSYGGSEL